MILHIPHASTNTLDKKFDCDLEQELYRMTDANTDNIFHHPNAKRVIFEVSRLICDVERFEDDSLEIMAKKGMGVCYETNSFGTKLRTLKKGEKEQIINDYYKPHHQALTEAVELELSETGSAIVIDCHSFSNEPLPHEESQTRPRPDICIGTDAYHTPDDLRDKVVAYFQSKGYSVKVNDPFSGTLIPMKYYQKDKRVKGIMIELNRNIDFKDDIFNCLSEI